MKKILFVLLVVLFFSCRMFEYDSQEPEYITFEEVSQSYFDKYGNPEDIYNYNSDGYHSIDWWWWSQGFMVNFLDTVYDNVNGWTVDSTYSFPPIGN